MGKYLDATGLAYLWGKAKAAFQAKLVSGTNIKTINNQSLLGSGNISIGGGLSNIVDASDGVAVTGDIDFTGNINDLYKITECAISTGGSISAHSYKEGESKTIPTSARVSGYNLVGVMGWATGNFRIIPHTHYVVDNTHLFVGFSNTSSSNVTTSVTVTFRLLWLKGTAKA